MDIAEIRPAERVIEIRHPGNDENLGLSVTIMSATDDRMKKLKRRLTDSALAKRQRNKAFTADEIEENQIAMIIEAATAWSWYGPDATYRGEKPEFNKTNLRKMLVEVEWFKSQLIAAIEEEKDFFPS